MNSLEKRSLTVTDVIKYFRKEGIIVNEKEAAEILDFLYFLAKLSVKQYLNDK